jgi:hypothetical protein
MPGVAKGQSLELFGSAGPTLTDPGNSVAVGAGFSPHSRLTLVFTFDRTHLESRTTTYPGGFSSSRGGTLYVGAAELRVVPFGRARFGPYGLAGLATGMSRPNVNDRFPDRVTNRVAAMFLGGGVQVPLGERFTVFGDGRMMFGGKEERASSRSRPCGRGCPGASRIPSLELGMSRISTQHCVEFLHDGPEVAVAGRPPARHS